MTPDLPDKKYRQLSRALLSPSEIDVNDYNELLKGTDLSVSKHLGRGGSGSIFIGKQEPLDRDVAIKLIPIFHGEVNRQILKKEGRIIAKLGHPNIVNVHDAKIVGNKDEQYYCLIMELVQGGSIGAASFTSAQDLLNAMIQICEGVEYAHSRGVIHCDLSLQNILLDDTNIPKISDFGVSQLTDKGASAPFLISGDYLAPEQLEPDADALDPRRDVYSLGVLLERLIARLASSGNQDPKDSFLLDSLQQIATEASATDPGERIPSVDLLQQKLQNLLPRVRSTKRLVWWSIASAISAITLFVLFVISNPEQNSQSGDDTEPRFSETPHPSPAPVITDVSPTEILNTRSNFWLEIRGKNFLPEQSYYCFASDLYLEDRTSESNAPAIFVNENLLKVFVTGVVENSQSHGKGYVRVRWGKSIDTDATEEFHYAYAITSKNRD